MNGMEHIDLLGKKAEDKVTGFAGVVTSVCFDLYGCVQAVITPGVDKDGKTRDGAWFDVVRVRVTHNDPVLEHPFASAEVHGPAEKPLPPKV